MSKEYIEYDSAGYPHKVREARAAEPAPKWAYTKQRDDLKHCPFCNTAAIEQGRLADNTTDMHYRILCGNPFCNLDCATHICAALKNAEQFWQTREGVR